MVVGDPAEIVLVEKTTTMQCAYQLVTQFHKTLYIIVMKKLYKMISYKMLLIVFKMTMKVHVMKQIKGWSLLLFRKLIYLIIGYYYIFVKTVKDLVKRKKVGYSMNLLTNTNLKRRSHVYLPYRLILILLMLL